jgi:MFS family permease
LIRNFTQALFVGAIFGLAFGAFCTADWVLALDLLPEEEKSAKNLGIWNYAGVGPQVIAPAIGGILLDKFNLIKYNLGYQAVFTAVIIYLIIGTLILIKVKEKEF